MSKRINDLSEKFDLNNWPHQFTKDGNPYQVGEEKDGVIGKGDPIMAAPMVCIRCGVRFVSGLNNRPPDPCPARTKKTEMKRLLS